MKQTRRGFTLLDLAVTSAGAVLLLGMLLPAAQEVKEAEKRQRCVNNLKQLGIAAHHYEASYNRLPPGWLGPRPVNETSENLDNYQNLSVLVFLLPCLEQHEVYKAVQVKSQPISQDYFTWKFPPNGKSHPNAAWYKHPDLLAVGRTPIKDFVCPSAPDMLGAADGVLVAVHFANKGGDKQRPLVLPPMRSLPRGEAGLEKLGTTNYFGVSGMYGGGTCNSFPGTLHGLARFAGVFTNRSQTSINQITSADGTANTLMFGEATGGSHDWQSDKPAAKAPTQYAASWMGAAALPTGGGLARHGDRSYWYQFSSAHEGVVNFCMADGAVRALRAGTTAARLFPTPQFPAEPPDRTTDSPYWVLQELAGVRDGGVRPLSSVVVKDPP